MKRVPLHEVHTGLNAKMVPFAGFEMPVRYSSDKEEHLQVRNAVGVFDVSHMGEFMVTGPHALDLIQKVTSNDASKLTIGQAQYSCFPNDRGGIVDDLIVYRLNEEKYMLVVNASNIDKDWNWVSSQNSFGAEMENISDDICLFAVQGPKAQTVLQRLTDVPLRDIQFYHFVEGAMAGIDDVIISATGYTGAGGFELYVKKEHAVELWNKVFEAGAEEGIMPIGLGARDTLRLEMGYCLYGNDITDETSPLEAGLGWITKFTKDFVNAEALQQQKEAGVARRLVGLKMVDKGIPRKDYEIVDGDGSALGIVTSGTMSPSLGIGVGLGYVQSGSHKSGTEVFIQNQKQAGQSGGKPATLCREIMTAEVCLTPALIDQFDLQGKNVVIIDIFRATSCMVTGLCNEVTAIYPVASVDECLAHGDQGRIMAGERGGQKLEAFDIGNSPYDYLSEAVLGREVAVTTTNGTLAIDKSRSANQIIVAAFLNLSATRDYLLELGGDIVLHCAGWKGSVNLEDTLFAGALLEALGDHIEIVGDAAQMALSLFQHHKEDLIGVARSSGHAQRLAKFGIVKDIDFCMTFDKYEGVIVMDGDRLVKRS